MPKTYQGLGMSFHYPDNWRIVEMAEDPLAIDAVSFESPETAVLHISRYPASREPDQLLEEAVRSMREEFDEVEQEDLLFDLGDSESFGCELTFFVLDFNWGSTPTWCRCRRRIGSLRSIVDCFVRWSFTACRLCQDFLPWRSFLRNQPLSCNR
jgi:hypothetical protein